MDYSNHKITLQGSPLSAAVGFIDGFSQLADAGESALEALLAQTEQSIRNHSHSHSHSTPPLLLIDDLACLKWLGIADSAVEGFVKGLLKVAEEVGACWVVAQACCSRVHRYSSTWI